MRLKDLIITIVVVFILLNIFTAMDIVPKTQALILYEREVDVSVYRAREEETNSNPTVTASGFIIRQDVNLVAVSRDLLDVYPYGSILFINHPEINEKYGCLFVVLDTTNERLSNTIDILISDNDKIGKWTNVGVRRISKREKVK